ncbi:rho guanine nucleotide exchange factor 12, partial [Paramuricea clavata]
VNGTLVTNSNHKEVVTLIKAGSYVALTLLGKPPSSRNSGSASPSAGSLSPGIGSPTSPSAELAIKSLTFI